VQSSPGPVGHCLAVFQCSSHALHVRHCLVAFQCSSHALHVRHCLVAFQCSSHALHGPVKLKICKRSRGFAAALLCKSSLIYLGMFTYPCNICRAKDKVYVCLHAKVYVCAYMQRYICADMQRYMCADMRMYMCADMQR